MELGNCIILLLWKTRTIFKKYFPLCFLMCKMEIIIALFSWPKSSFRFLSKNKRHFSFSPRTLLNNVFTALFHYLLPFFRQLHSIFLKCFIVLSKQLFQVPFTVFQGLEFFSIKRILYKDQNKWKSEGAITGEYSQWIS